MVKANMGNCFAVQHQIDSSSESDLSDEFNVRASIKRPPCRPRRLKQPLEEDSDEEEEGQAWQAWAQEADANTQQREDKKKQKSSQPTKKRKPKKKSKLKKRGRKKKFGKKAKKKEEGD